MKPRLLQVCNVGQICGGTAACAWTVTRALPGWDHTVAFLGPIAAETLRAFKGVQLVEWSAVTRARLNPFRPDVVLLHNTAPGRIERVTTIPKIMYRHSAAPVAAGDVTLCCSHWLSARCRRSSPAADVLWQGVPRAMTAAEARCADRVIVGRICTPQSKKWPARLVPFYGELARKFPTIEWEFVGCPEVLQLGLYQACGGRAQFWSAGWERRSLLTRWTALLHHQPEVPESFGRTVAEGMRVGCLPIVDRRGGFIEQLDAGGGWLCDTPDDFSRSIGELLEEKERSHRAKLAMEVAESRWSLERFGRELLKWFDVAAEGDGLG